MGTQSIQSTSETLDLLGTERLPVDAGGQGFDTAAWFLFAGAVLFALMVNMVYFLQQEPEGVVVTTWRD